MLKYFKLACFVLIPIFIVLGYLWFPDSVKTVVTGTNIKSVDGVGTYLVFTNYETMINRDCGWLLKWNSDDVQAAARRLKDKKVRIRKYGFDFPFYSMRENILSIEEVPK